MKHHPACLLPALIFALAIAATAVGTTAPAERVPIAAIAPICVKQGWGSMATNKSVQGNKLNIAGREFATGIGTHADSEIVCDLEGAYNLFQAWVGVDHEMASYPEASVRFRVLGDGKELFDSGIMRAKDAAKRVDVPVKGVQTLTLIAGDAGDGTNCDHADWADPHLSGPAKPASAPPVKYRVRAPGIELRLSAEGKIVGVNSYAVTGGTRLAGCATRGRITATPIKGGGLQFRKALHHGDEGDCALIERFIPTRDSIRWELEIHGKGKPWSTAISTILGWPATPRTRFWTAWASPGETSDWQDPLVTKPVADASWQYGGMFDQSTGYISLPVATVIEPAKAVSLIMSPEDTTLNAALSTTTRGAIVFTRTNNRISAAGSPVKFSLDIVPHAPDFRPALGWMVRRYPKFFEPANSTADEIAGLGAYSAHEGPLDADKLKRMGFRVNWKASYDFPYMGMYIPPVADDEPWKPLDKRPTMTIRQLADYSKQMRGQGFYVLNYFNCTEIGNNIKWPAPPRRAADGKDLWKDPNDFVFHQMPSAWVRSPSGGPVYSWVGCVFADCGDPAYRDFLIDQARLHVEKLPLSSGICIDRMDWLRLYNAGADDGVSWLDGKPARFLMNSWNALMPEIGRLMHSAGKAIFVNPIFHRIDAMRHTDGIYDEFGHLGSCLNASSFMALRKPVIAWTPSQENLRPDPDAYFQRHLYMGAFPTAPVPVNDHTINPSDFAVKYYLDYGPLFDALRGRKWVLVRRAVEVSGGTARANIFSVPDGYVVPVVSGGGQERARVTVGSLPGIGSGVICKALYPGHTAWSPVAAKPAAKGLVLEVPLQRGCAMVRIKLAEEGEMNTDAVCSPNSIPISTPVDLELKIRHREPLQAGDKIEVQFPNSWLMVNGPSFTRELQTQNPKSQHYISVTSPGTDAAFSIEITPRHLNFPEGASRHGRLITATLTKGAIPAGKPILLRYSNTFSPYIAETETVWVRVKGETPEELPTLTATPGEAVATRVIVPSQAAAGQKFDVLITTLDRSDNCSSTRFENQALMLDGEPVAANLSFAGSIRVPVSIEKEGIHRFRFGETVSNAVRIGKNAPRVYWGDLHIHTKLSHDAMGCDPYGYAREVSGLDFAAACDHVESLGKGGYDQLVQWAAKAYEPGKFASILADERIPPITGHHNIYFRDVDSFLAAASLQGKREFTSELDPHTAMVLPHHTGIAFGDLKSQSHGVDLSKWDAQGLRPVMEVYSHHGQSELYSPQHALAYEFNRLRNPERRANTSIFGPYYAQDYWKAGYRLGVIASSDEHSGQGGRRHGGIAAVMADELTREGIFDSIRARRCYATTGERILIDFAVNGSAMGTELTAKKGESVSIDLKVYGTELLVRVEVLRFRFGIDQDFRPILSASPRPESLDAAFHLEDKIDGPCMYYARVVQQPLTWPGMAWSSPVWVDVE